VYTFNQPGTYDVWMEIWDEFDTFSAKERADYITVLPFP